MSCTDFSYTPDGRRGLGVNQPQGGMDYPLVDPSADVQYLLADFHIAYDDQTHVIQHPLKIKWLYGVGCTPASKPTWAPTPTHTADVLVVDANNVVVFDSTQATTFNSWCWGLSKTANCADTHPYQIYEWRDTRTTCQLVAYKTWPLLGDNNDVDVPRNYSQHLAPVNAVLDERAVYKKPKRVTSFILIRSRTNPLLNVQMTQPTAEFASGYNMQIAAEADAGTGLRRANTVEFNAQPGAGLGRFVNCGDTPVVITSLNGLTGPDVILDAHDCLWVRPPLTYIPTGSGPLPNLPNSQTGVLRRVNVNGHATQQIGSDCKTPCCTCDDYVDLALYMNSTRDRYKNIGSSAGVVLTAHSENVERWLEQRTCRQSRPLKGCMTPQRCPYMDVVVQYCNLCEACVQDAVLNIEFDAPNAAVIACGYTSISNSRAGSGAYRINGEWPSFTAPLGQVDAGNSVSVTFRLEFENPQPTPVKLTLTGTTANGPIVAGCTNEGSPFAAVLTKQLRCSESGTTVQYCE